MNSVITLAIFKVLNWILNPALRHQSVPHVLILAKHNEYLCVLVNFVLLPISCDCLLGSLISLLLSQVLCLLTLVHQLEDLLHLVTSCNRLVGNGSCAAVTFPRFVALLEEAHESRLPVSEILEQPRPLLCVSHICINYKVSKLLLGLKESLVAKLSKLIIAKLFRLV